MPVEEETTSATLLKQKIPWSLIQIHVFGLGLAGPRRT